MTLRIKPINQPIKPNKMKIEVEKCIKEDGETWYYVKVNGLSQIATQDKDKAISLAKIYESNYKKFGSINPSIIIHSVEL